MAKVDRCVVRNQAYRQGEFSIRERHNERKNESYHNGDVVLVRSHLNVHFKASENTYEQTFNQMVEDGSISLRGLRKDAKVFDELVFDVNTGYFEEHGGYEYAKEFFAEAYKLAVKEAGGEQYVLSAVMHADERNKALSEQMGRDVFHYHLHVVYVPVVEKEVRWTKRCKDPELVGKVKEVITQVSHSKKWPLVDKLDEHGKPVLTSAGKPARVNSYSLLQDRFHEHMRAAGFTDIERGERGKTAEHLNVLDFKIKQDEARDAALGKGIKAKKKELAAVNKELTVAEQAAATFSEIEGMAKKTLLGKIELSPESWKTVSGLAQKGVVADATIHDLTEKLAAAKRDARIYKSRWEKLMEETKPFREALKRAPRRVLAFLADVSRKPPEKQEQAPTKDRKRTAEQTR